MANCALCYKDRPLKLMAGPADPKGIRICRPCSKIPIPRKAK